MIYLIKTIMIVDKIFNTIWNGQYVYYINDKPIKDIRKEIDDVKAYITIIWYDNIIHILYLKTNEKYRGHGYATNLLKHTLALFENDTYDYVYVDDMSDNFNKPHNIYKKFGFNYLLEGEPEMIGSLKAILKKLRT